MSHAGRFITAVLLAAGRGERVGGDLPKQFLELGDSPMFVHPLRTLSNCALVDAIVVVVPEVRPAFLDDEFGVPKVVSVTSGGVTRQDSLGEGLVCVPDQTAIVIVHDAARPLVREALVERVLGALDDSREGAIAALPVSDALKEVSSGEILGGRSRSGLWRAQTPQAFHRAALEEAVTRAQADGFVCDDCAEMVFRAGYRVRVVEGDSDNIKVSSPADLRLCEAILAARIQ